jgi:hypothetical protein
LQFAGNCPGLSCCKSFKTKMSVINAFEEWWTNEHR